MSASSAAALLGGLAYELRHGVQDGIASTRGISPDFVQVTSDTASTPQQITVLTLLVAAALTVAMLLIPALTIWQSPLLLAIYCLGSSAWERIAHPHSAGWQAGLLIAVALCGYAALVAAASPAIRWLYRRARRPRAEAPTLPRWMTWLLRQPGAQLIDKLERQTDLAIAILVASLLLTGAFAGTRKVGNWIGEHGPAPNQAVVKGGVTYAWLGTTSTGSMVVRAADFCGASEPEQASYVQINGARSLILQPENQFVISLSSRLRVVRHCPAK